MDKRVEIHATSRADLNGKRGVATDFHPMNLGDRTTWRYTVKLDGGEAFKLKRANVRSRRGRCARLSQFEHGRRGTGQLKKLHASVFLRWGRGWWVWEAGARGKMGHRAL